MGDIKSDCGNKECEIVYWMELALRLSASSCEVYQGSPTSVHWRATQFVWIHSRTARLSTCIESWGEIESSDISKGDICFIAVY